MHDFFRKYFQLGKKTLKTNDDKVLPKQGENETVIKRSTEELTGSNADTSNQKMSLSLIVSFIADIEHLSVLVCVFVLDSRYCT